MRISGVEGWNPLETYAFLYFFCTANWWHTTQVVWAEPIVTLGGDFVPDVNLLELSTASSARSRFSGREGLRFTRGVQGLEFRVEG